MKRLKSGTHIQITDAGIEWMEKHSKELCGPYPGWGNITDWGTMKTIPRDEGDYIEELMTREMWTQADMDRPEGVICKDNSEFYGYGDGFAYLVWVANDFGFECTYMEPEWVERI